MTMEKLTNVFFLKKKKGLYRFEKFEIFANGHKIEVGVKAEDVNPTARTASVEDDSVGAGVGIHGRELAGKGIRRGAGGRHEKEYKGDEKKREGNDEDDSSVPLDLVQEGIMLLLPDPF